MVHESSTSRPWWRPQLGLGTRLAPLVVLLVVGLVGAGRAWFGPDLRGYGKPDDPRKVLVVGPWADGLSTWLNAMGFSGRGFERYRDATILLDNRSHEGADRSGFGLVAIDLTGPAAPALADYPTADGPLVVPPNATWAVFSVGDLDRPREDVTWVERLGVPIHPEAIPGRSLVSFGSVESELQYAPVHAARIGLLRAVMAHPVARATGPAPAKERLATLEERQRAFVDRATAFAHTALPEDTSETTVLTGPFHQATAVPAPDGGVLLVGRRHPATTDGLDGTRLALLPEPGLQVVHLPPNAGGPRDGRPCGGLPDEIVSFRAGPGALWVRPATGGADIYTISIADGACTLEPQTRPEGDQPLVPRAGGEAVGVTTDGALAHYGNAATRRIGFDDWRFEPDSPRWTGERTLVATATRTDAPDDPPHMAWVALPVDGPPRIATLALGQLDGLAGIERVQAHPVGDERRGVVAVVEHTGGARLFRIRLSAPADTLTRGRDPTAGATVRPLGELGAAARDVALDPSGRHLYYRAPFVESGDEGTALRGALADEIFCLPLASPNARPVRVTTNNTADRTPWPAADGWLYVQTRRQHGPDQLWATRRLAATCTTG